MACVVVDDYSAVVYTLRTMADSHAFSLRRPEYVFELKKSYQQHINGGGKGTVQALFFYLLIDSDLKHEMNTSAKLQTDFMHAVFT